MTDATVDCSWCGAECEGRFKSTRGEVFCSAAHRDASARAVKALHERDADESRPSLAATVEDFAALREQVDKWDVPAPAMTVSSVTITEYEDCWVAADDDGTWQERAGTAAEALDAVKRRDTKRGEDGTSSVTTVTWAPKTKIGLMVAKALCHRPRR